MRDFTEKSTLVSKISNSFIHKQFTQFHDSWIILQRFQRAISLRISTIINFSPARNSDTDWSIDCLVNIQNMLRYARPTVNIRSLRSLVVVSCSVKNSWTVPSWFDQSRERTGRTDVHQVATASKSHRDQADQATRRYVKRLRIYRVSFCHMLISWLKTGRDRNAHLCGFLAVISHASFADRRSSVRFLSLSLSPPSFLHLFLSLSPFSRREVTETLLAESNQELYGRVDRSTRLFMLCWETVVG